MKKVASLRYGVIFKKAFSKPHIFTAFVNDCFGINLEIDKVETEKSFDPCVGKVDSRFDLFAEDKKHRAIVDIQHVRNADHYQRFLHYHCVALLEQVSNSKDYCPPMNVYTIVVLTSGDRHKVDIAEIDFDPKDLNGKGLGEIAHKILYLCPKYVNEQTPEPFREWMLAIQDSLDETVNEACYQKPEIQEIFNLIEQDQTTPKEYARMKDEYSYGLTLNTLYDKGVQQGLETGIQQGLEKGMQKGIETGIQQGLEKGIEKGMEKGGQAMLLANAKKMKDEGLELALIAKITGLALEDLQSL